MAVAPERRIVGCQSLAHAQRDTTTDRSDHEASHRYLRAIRQPNHVRMKQKMSAIGDFCCGGWPRR